MKYKLIKKLNGVPEWLEFDLWNIYLSSIVNIPEMQKLYDYINLVWIDDKDSFEKIEEDILVPERIEIGGQWDNLYIINWKKVLHSLKWEWGVWTSSPDYVVKCKLVKTAISELKPWDLFFVWNIIYINELSHYNVYLWDNKWVHWYDWVREVVNPRESRDIYKVVKYNFKS